MVILNFLGSALEDPAGCWDRKKIGQTSSMSVPDLIFGLNRDVLRNDAHQQWARWFVESFIDPRSFGHNNCDYTKIFADVWAAINGNLTHLPRPERAEVAKIVSKTLFGISKKFNLENQRKSISDSQKRLLLDISGKPPRCHYCGAIFDEKSINNYLGFEKIIPDQPLLFDVLRPRGISVRDLQIEIDHVTPFSRGGEEGENLKLSCGWCNRQKSNYVSIYDISGIPERCGPNTLGLHSIPHPFWSLRLIALRGSCEFHDGCDRNNRNELMMVAPICATGALNPSNLRVTCLEHDPLKENRFQPLTVIKKIWRID